MENEENLKYQLQSLKIDKERLENEHLYTVRELKSEHSIQIESLLVKISDFEEKLSESDRQCLKIESELSQEREIYDRKYKHYEQLIEDGRAKEKKLSNELRTLKNSYKDNLKELNSQNETKIRDLQSNLDSELERYNDLERNLEDKENS